jgi:hypothetical protein
VALTGVMVRTFVPAPRKIEQDDGGGLLLSVVVTKILTLVSNLPLRIIERPLSNAGRSWPGRPKGETDCGSWSREKGEEFCDRTDITILLTFEARQRRQ